MEGFHKLKIECPYSILNIEDIKISCRPSEHGYLYLKCLIDDSINFKYATEASTEDKIIIYEELENNEKSIIFNGIVQNVKTTNSNGIYYLELEAASSSINLDIKEKTRSFQDSNMSYDNLVNEILEEYKIYGFTQCMSSPMSIGRPLFQYKETDWNFLKRVASLLGLELICDIINTENVFYFGRKTGKKYELKGELDYKASKDLEAYSKAKTRDFGVDFHDTDFFYYEVKVREKLEIGDIIDFKQKELYVNQFEAKLHQGELIYKYRFCRKDGIWIDKIYNQKIKGVSIEGTVLETAGEKLKLHLNIDESQDPSTAEWFYYTPPTGNLLYSMPLVGENAMLYFQDEIEAAPIAINCVRENGDTCDSFSDTNNRYLATETGDYLDMLPGAINFHRSGFNVNLNDKSGINLSSSGNLSVSGGSVSISGGSVSINGSSQIKVQKGKSSYISLENEFYSEAGSTCECGSDRQSYGPFNDDEPTAGVAEALAKQRQALAKQNQESLKFNNGNLMSAMSGLKTNFSVPPTLDEFLEQRADMCKVKRPQAEIVPADKHARPITVFESLDIDRKNAPVEYKLDYVFKAFGAWYESGKNYFTTMGLIDGLQPEYADLYGDFTMGMGIESISTISITGFKSATGAFSSDGDIIVGSGIGNISKPTSKTFGQPIETTIGGTKVKLRVDAEPDANKIQIQAGHGKNSIVDVRIDPEMPLEPQIPKNLNLSSGQKKEMVRYLQKAVDFLSV